MLVKLSTDTWRDVFDFLGLTDRKELALTFNEFGDREFSAVCQKWLHEWIKDVRIGELEINSKDGESARLQLKCWDRKCKLKYFPIAGVELPANIVDFTTIQIYYFDAEVLEFLWLMQPIFRNVNLEIRSKQMMSVPFPLKKSVEMARNELVHVLPLLNHTGAIDSIQLFTDQLLSTIRELLAVQFFGIKQLQVTAPHVGNDNLAEGTTELLLNWLGTRHVDGEPRMLEISFSKYISNAYTFIEDICRDFRNSTWPSSFFIRFCWFWSHRYVHDSTAQNSNTNEQLLVRKPMRTRWEPRHCGHVLIGRCPSKMDGDKWIDEMKKQRDRSIWLAESQSQRRITIFYPIPKQAASSEEGSEDESEDEYAFLRGPDYYLYQDKKKPYWYS